MFCKFEIGDSHSPVNKSRIQKVERSIGVRLPDSYCEFLLQHNGGVVYDNLIPKNGDSVRSFYGIDTGFAWDDLEIVRESTDWIPKSYLAFADNDGGDQYCLGLSNRNFGAVVLFEWHRKRRPVSRSFEEFLDDIVIRVDEDEMAEMSDLEIAICRNDLKSIRELATDGNRNDALLFAASRPRLKSARLLLELGADVNARDGAGDSPLHNAVYAQSVDMIRLLIECGALINQRNHDGSTPLLIAAQCCYIRPALCLIKAGADVSVKNAEGESVRSICEDEPDSMQKEYLHPVLDGQ
jgi:cell wall assembly regulator SMI1